MVVVGLAVVLLGCASMPRHTSHAPTPHASAAASQPTVGPPATVSALLEPFGSSQITTYHMPTANPAWVDRINPVADFNVNIDEVTPGMRNLIALVDEAAHEGDTASLLRLCFECQTDPSVKARVAAALSQDGALAQLSLLLESTHAISQDGLTYPSFALTPDQPDPIMTADTKTLGASSPSAYLSAGLVTMFPRYAGPNVDGSAHWAGVTVGVGS